MSDGSFFRQRETQAALPEKRLIRKIPRERIFFVHSMENCYFILQQGENMIYNKEIMC